MNDQPAKKAPFIEWGRQETVFEDKACGKKIRKSRKFITGTAAGKFTISIVFVSLAATLAMSSIPSGVVEALWNYAIRLF
jgi:hypothetical protein